MLYLETRTNYTILTIARILRLATLAAALDIVYVQPEQLYVVVFHFWIFSLHTFFTSFTQLKKNLYKKFKEIT